jgi:hypothetical protein
VRGLYGPDMRAAGAVAPAAPAGTQRGMWSADREERRAELCTG